MPRRTLQFEAEIPTLAVFRDAGTEVRTVSLPGIAMRYGLTDTVELRATLLGLTYTPVDDATDTTNAAVAALVSRPIAEGWTGALEFTVFPGLNNLSGQAFAGAFVVWTVTNDRQLDLSADFGLSEHSPEVIAAFGISWRF